MALKSLYATHVADPGFDSTDAVDGSKENLGFVWHLTGPDDGELDRVWIYVGNPSAFGITVEFCHYAFFAVDSGDHAPIYSESFVAQSSVGWQEHLLATPQTILTGVDYVGNFFWNATGHYSYKLGTFTGSGSFGAAGLTATDGRFKDNPTRRFPDGDTSGQYGLDIGVTVDAGGGTVGTDPGMVPIVKALQDICELIAATGIPATFDRQALEVPGVLLGPALIDFDRLDSDLYELTIDVYLIVGDNGDTESLIRLGSMLKTLAPILRPGEVTAVGMSLPNHGADPLPALTFKSTFQITED